MGRRCRAGGPSRQPAPHGRSPVARGAHGRAFIHFRRPRPGVRVRLRACPARRKWPRQSWACGGQGAGRSRGAGRAGAAGRAERRRRRREPTSSASLSRRAARAGSPHLLPFPPRPPSLPVAAFTPREAPARRRRSASCSREPAGESPASRRRGWGGGWITSGPPFLETSRSWELCPGYRDGGAAQPRGREQGDAGGRGRRAGVPPRPGQRRFSAFSCRCCC